MSRVIILLVLIWSTSVQAQVAACACCNENSRAFDFWLGEWEVTANGKAAGHNSIDKLQGECVLRENWTSATPGYTGTSYNFYNAGKQQWQQLWLDNQGGSLELAGQRVGQQMIMSSDKISNSKGQEVEHRITWTLNDDGTVRQLWETTTDGEVQIAFDGLYVKKAAE